jgi:transposase
MSIISRATQAADSTGPATRVVVAGVDTHQRTHHAAVLDETGRRLADREFPATVAGYQTLVDWVAEHGLSRETGEIGVESTGSYGAGLTRHLLVAGIEVVEVTRPEKTTRARQGKSDPIDAESAARQVLAGTATGRPKLSTGIVEAIRNLKIPRDGAVRDRTRAFNQLRDLVTTAPTPIHDELIVLTGRARVARAASYRSAPTRLAEPAQAAKRALRRLARRIQTLDTEIAEADAELDELTAHAVPTLRALPQVGTQTAAQLAITAGQNTDRLRSEASFAKLTGVAPLPASSGKRNHRHRLNRGGDRQANNALHMIVIGRLKNHHHTRTYRQRRQQEGLGKLDIIRCLKRHLIRQVYRALRDDLMTP